MDFLFLNCLSQFAACVAFTNKKVWFVGFVSLIFLFSVVFVSAFILRPYFLFGRGCGYTKLADPTCWHSPFSVYRPLQGTMGTWLMEALITGARRNRLSWLKRMCFLCCMKEKKTCPTTLSFPWPPPHTQRSLWWQKGTGRRNRARENEVSAGWEFYQFPGLFHSTFQKKMQILSQCWEHIMNRGSKNNHHSVQPQPSNNTPREST